MAIFVSAHRMLTQFTKTSMDQHDLQLAHESHDERLWTGNYVNIVNLLTADFVIVYLRQTIFVLSLHCVSTCYHGKYVAQKITNAHNTVFFWPQLIH